MKPPLRERILLVFREMKRDSLDLHVLFEAAGNDPAERSRVLEAIEELETEGLIEARGSDFYALTKSGKAALARL